MRQIDSPQNPYIKHLIKLAQDSHYRHLEGKVLIEGKGLIEEILPKVSSGICLSTDFFPKESFRGIENVKISEAVARKLGSFESQEPCFAEIPIPKAPLPKCKRLLVLDGVSDPGNLGTLMRTALALGWEGIFLLPGCADPFQGKVIRASKGAIFKIPYQKGSWEELLKMPLTFIGADLTGNLPKKGQEENLALVLGNEGQGLSKEARKHCTLVSLPMKGEMESLNVAVAGGILMYIMRPYG